MGAQSRQEQALIEKLSLPFLRDIYIIAMLRDAWLLFYVDKVPPPTIMVMQNWHKEFAGYEAAKQWLGRRYRASVCLSSTYSYWGGTSGYLVDFLAGKNSYEFSSTDQESN